MPAGCEFAGCVCECDQIHPYCWNAAAVFNGHHGDRHCYRSSSSTSYSTTTCVGNCTHSAIVLGALLPQTGVSFGLFDRMFDMHEGMATEGLAYGENNFWSTPARCRPSERRSGPATRAPAPICVVHKSRHAYAHVCTSIHTSLHMSMHVSIRMPYTPWPAVRPPAQICMVRTFVQRAHLVEMTLSPSQAPMSPVRA